MKHTNLLKLLSAGILAAGITVLPLTLPEAAQAQTTTGTNQTTDTYRDNPDWGWWGLLGLAGLLGFANRGRTHAGDRDAATYRDPNR